MDPPMWLRCTILLPMAKKRIILFASILLVVASCATNQPPIVPSPTKTTLVPENSPTPKSSVWSIYDADPDHPWNRVFRQLYRRVAADGREYGWAELDPLLWFDTDYLLEGIRIRKRSGCWTSFFHLTPRIGSRTPSSGPCFSVTCGRSSTGWLLSLIPFRPSEGP